MRASNSRLETRDRGSWSALRVLANEMDFAMVELFEARPVASMDDHRVRKQIPHVLHQIELAELIERRCRLVHDEDVGWLDQTRTNARLLFSARKE